MCPLRYEVLGTILSMEAWMVATTCIVVIEIMIRSCKYLV
jgi:hypothetical protein